MKSFIITAAFLLICSAVSGSSGSDLHIDRYLGSFTVSSQTLSQRNALQWSVGVETVSEGRIFSARQVLSSGIAQADYRICTYEDGSPIFEDGKYFFCVSSRLAGVTQTVYAYHVNTCRFELIGMMQGYKDSEPFAFIAPHIIYNRKDGLWYVFAHWESPHNLCVGRCYRDPRYGYNEVHAELLDYSDRTKGDEDNFVFFDSSIGKWVLVYSKGSSTMSKQVSDSIDGGYRLICEQNVEKTLTGINVVSAGGKRYIVTGSMWKPEEDAYKVFDYDSLEYLYNLDLDIPTGGFRGWGTVIPITEGLQTKYQLLTFDRIKPDTVDNWQYGNIYIYEAVERNPGIEFDIVRPDGKVLKANATQEYAPSELHFRRKSSQRLNYSQELSTGLLDLSFSIFLPNGNVYPLTSSGSVSCSQDGASVHVCGKGSAELLGGTHLPACEYVIDLSRMSEGEKRYLKISGESGEVSRISFSRDASAIQVSGSAEETMTIPSEISKVRIIISGTTAHILDATEIN